MTDAAKTLEKTSPTVKISGTKHTSPVASPETSFPMADQRFMAGNQAMQHLAQTRATVSQPGDVFEREADRRASEVVSGRASRPGGTASGLPFQRKADGGSPAVRSGSRPEGGLRSSGQMLDRSVRNEMESGFGVDFSDVRVHTDDRSAQSARSLGALAYTTGRDVVFNSGQYAPHSAAGRFLLAHELAHVVQQTNSTHAPPAGTLQRLCDPSVSSCAEGAQLYTPNPLTLQSLLSSQATLTASPAPAPQVISSDPCQVDVAVLTNANLLAQYSIALGVVNRGRDATGYFDYRNLQRRLITERDRRVTLGHAWLATMPTAVPEQLYRIVDSASGIFQVLAVPGTTVSGAPEDISSSPLMVRSQFDRFLETHNIVRVGADEYMLMAAPPPQTVGAGMSSTMVAGGRLYNTPLDMLLMDPFARPIRSASGGIINKWSGRLGEAGFESRASQGFGLFLDDLNARNWVDRRGVTHTPAQENYPTFDFERTVNTPGVEILGVSRVSVKTSLQPNQVDRFAYYREGMAGMLEAPNARSALSTYIANDPQMSAATTGSQYDATRARVLGEASMAINADDVAAFRRLLSDPMLRETPQSATSVWNDRGGQVGPRRITGWRSVLEGVMRDNPATIDTPGGRRIFSSPDALDLALQNHQITPEQHMNAQREVGRSAAVKVIPHNLETAGGVGLRNARLNIPLTEAQLRTLVTPEYLRAQRAGGGFGGDAYAAGGAGLQGAGISGLISVVTTAGVMYFDERTHPNWQKELALGGGMGSLGGGAGSVSEQLLISGGTRLMINDVAATGVSRLTPGLVIGAGRFGGGAVGAMFVEGISIGLLEEREHSGLETGTRLARSGVLGGASIWAGAGIGAAAGSVVPVAGTAVGFVVGLLVGGALYYIGDKVVPGGREDWDAYEAGCQPRPAAPPPGTAQTSAAQRAYEDLPMHYCFASDTPVQLADGTSKWIAELRIGEEVLSYDERDASLHTEQVVKIEATIAPAHLKLHLAHNGTEIRVTGEHPLHTEGLWVPAKMLKVGSRVTWLEAEGNEVGEAEVAGITQVMQPTVVYDLSVSNCHTFFAGGLLAHNKNI